MSLGVFVCLTRSPDALGDFRECVLRTTSLQHTGPPTGAQGTTCALGDTQETGGLSENKNNGSPVSALSPNVAVTGHRENWFILSLGCVFCLA